MQTKLKASHALTALIPLIIILSSFSLLVFNKQFYYDELGANNANQRIDNAREKTEDVINYLKTGEQTKSEMSADELMHLGDVRARIWAVFFVLAALVAVAVLLGALLFAKNKSLIFDSMYYGGIITAVGTIVILLIFTVAFEQAFTLFHKLIFTNNFWLLPADSTLINLFPEDFFIDFAKRIGLNSIIISLLLIMIGRLKKR